jgi:D-alanyl-D-alanine dipeptidase
MYIRSASFILFLFAGLAASGATRGHRTAKAIESSRELIVVTTSNWSAVDGIMRRFTRSESNNQWIVAGEPVAVVVGKNGLGWGAGLVDTDVFRAPSDPLKKEGDGKAPAGVFSLGEAFGYADKSIPDEKLPYVHLTDAIECVDDPASKFYNRVLDRGSVSPDWNSSEHMHRSDELYRWGLVVEHNANPTKSGGGSCIFMHIWRGPREGTAGCTAMPQPEIEKLLGWLDPARKPLLVQMPESEYRRLRKKWKLPALENAGK